MPRGRDENGPYHTLADWVRPKNMYGSDGLVEANGRSTGRSAVATFINKASVPGALRENENREPAAAGNSPLAAHLPGRIAGE
jgi:hypothetical protein